MNTFGSMEADYKAAQGNPELEAELCKKYSKEMEAFKNMLENPKYVNDYLRKNRPGIRRAEKNYGLLADILLDPAPKEPKNADLVDLFFFYIDGYEWSERYKARNSDNPFRVAAIEAFKPMEKGRECTAELLKALCEQGPESPLFKKAMKYREKILCEASKVGAQDIAGEIYKLLTMPEDALEEIDSLLKKGFEFITNKELYNKVTKVPIDKTDDCDIRTFTRRLKETQQWKAKKILPFIKPGGTRATKLLWYPHCLTSLKKELPYR